jgi:hypothetical protein
MTGDFFTTFQNDILPVQLGVNKPPVIPCAAQLLKVLGVDDLAEGSFMPPSTSVPSNLII